MSKAGLFGTVLVVAATVCACGGPDEPTITDAASAAGPAAAVAPAAAPATTSSPAAPAGTGSGSGSTGYGTGAETVVVTSVTDGDTFRVGERRIRVIGIDSCETGTTGGRDATAAARRWLSGATVTLTREPGVDLDRYGREVRYVGTASGDFGRLMVPATHTGVYRGGNNASASYLAGLTALDAGGRSCGASTEPATRQAAPTTERKAALQAAPRTEAPRTAAPRPVAQAPATKAPAAKAPASSGGTYYKNCTAARAAGAAPLYRGQPGYAAKLDRDNDGVACE